MKESIIQEKSYKFAIRIVKLYLHLKDTKRETTLSKQILRYVLPLVQILKKPQALNQEKIFLIKYSFHIRKLRKLDTGCDYFMAQDLLIRKCLIL